MRSTSVAQDFFDTFDAPIVSGRNFTPADADFDRPVVIVDQTFVQTILGGRDPVGLRVRQPQNSENPTAGPWYQIVGVVRDFSTAPDKSSEDAMLYRLAAPGTAAVPMHLVVRARGAANSLAPTVRSVAAATDPTLRLYDPVPLDEIDRAEVLTHGFLIRALAIVCAVALLLSTAGVYSLMLFTLSRRTREIGIRTALGAAPRRIVTAIFSRAFVQVGLGVLAGSVQAWRSSAWELRRSHAAAVRGLRSAPRWRSPRSSSS